MSFAERIRQLIEVEKQQKAAEEEARRQEKAAEKELHEQRRQQALAFRQESGVDLLVAELGRFLEEAKRGKHDGPSTAEPSEYTEHYQCVTRRDADSIFDNVKWDNRRTDRLEYRTEEYEVKIVAVETCLDGRVIFHAYKDVMVKTEVWRYDRKYLEDALEEAFKRPKVCTYKIYNFKGPEIRYHGGPG